MREQQILDDYITKIPEYVVTNQCEECGKFIEGDAHIELEHGLLCSDECIEDYYGVKEQELIKYCDSCNEHLPETYIKDEMDNVFCDMDCLKKWYDM